VNSNLDAINGVVVAEGAILSASPFSRHIIAKAMDVPALAGVFGWD
jgi:signal transduction protein with GAF and PtsI domain